MTYFVTYKGLFMTKYVTDKRLFELNVQLESYIL